MRPTRRHLGFSLIELLVVVAIIAVLAGLLLAAIGPVKKSSRRMVCTSNLRQIGLGILAYSNDNQGFFPTYNDSSCYGWPYIAGDWCTGSTTYKGQAVASFYQDYLPVGRSVFYCPEGLTWQLPLNGEVAFGWISFPNPPPPVLTWILDINYNYFAGPNEKGTNLRGGPRHVGEGTARSTLIADLMKFGSAAPYTTTTTWNHRSEDKSGLTDRWGGNMFYMDGRVAWMSGVSELLKHRQKMRGSDSRSYAAEQKGDL
ncbi:MAG: prepilin-type N-terminal cleavage/methylation domain-containing protein [Planctomycetes bacterium]|nr:prepilin-type N-terminal cleavage/methylation domain-containing protein [Planctomycetota bacterium]